MMISKTCPKCKNTKLTSEFCKSKHRKDGFAVHCKSCANVYNKKARSKRPQHYRSKQKEIVARHLARYQTWKAAQVCSVCGEATTTCLDLHHRDPSKKDFVISAMTRQKGWHTLLKEIEKCVVLCANCHRKVHAGLLILP